MGSYVIYDSTRQDQRAANTDNDSKKRKKYRRHQFIAFRNSPYWMKQASGTGGTNLRAEFVSPNFIPTQNRCLKFRYIIPFVQNKKQNNGRGSGVDDAMYKIWPYMSRLEV